MVKAIVKATGKATQTTSKVSFCMFFAPSALCCSECEDKCGCAQTATASCHGLCSRNLCDEHLVPLIAFLHVLSFARRTAASVASVVRPFVGNAAVF